MTLNCVPHQVRAGRTVYLLEERAEIAGDGADGPVVRALIALDADEASDPFEEDRWRLAYAATLGTALWGPGTSPAHVADAPLGAPRGGDGDGDGGGGGGGSGSGAGAAAASGIASDGGGGAALRKAAAAVAIAAAIISTGSERLGDIAAGDSISGCCGC